MITHYAAPANLEIVGEVVFTGQFDRLYTQKRKCEDCEGSGFTSLYAECPKCKGTGWLNHGLLIDYKALHGKHAGALENPQLMGLAVLVAKRHKLTSLRVALVQPWAGKPTIADYGEAGLALAESLLLQILADERNAGPEDRKAGDWCTYCKARFTCDIYTSHNINALDVVQAETLPADPKARFAEMTFRFEQMSPEKMKRVAENVIPLMGGFIASFSAAYKKRV